MGATMVLIALALILYECCSIPIKYKYDYIAEYGGDGPSLILSGMLGISIFLLYLFLYMDSVWSGFSLIIFIVLLTANIYWIIKEMIKPTVPKGAKIKFVMCHIFFAIGVFGIIFMLLGAFSSTGKNNKKKK